MASRSSTATKLEQIFYPGTENAPPMNISFKIGEITHGGIVTAVPKATETQYFLELGGSLPFTIRLSEEGIWETDNPEIDPELVQAAGNQVECMEDLVLN